MRGKLKVTVTRTEDKPGAMPLVIVNMEEERDEDILPLDSRVVFDPDPFKGQMMLTEDMVLPLYNALQEYVREHYA